MNKDGSNIAEYVLTIREGSPEIFQGIIETLQYVLPYAKDIQPSITSELERMVYVQLTEQDFKVPGLAAVNRNIKITGIISCFPQP